MVLRNLIDLGLLYRTQQKYDKAQEALREALSRSESAVGPRHQATLDAAWWLSTTLHDQCHLDEAESLALRCAESYSNALGDSHRETVLVWQWLQKIRDQKAEKDSIRVFCDRCSTEIAIEDKRLHCTVCYGGSFDICEKCVAAKRRCLRAHQTPIEAMFDGKRLICSTTGLLLRDYRNDYFFAETDPIPIELPQEQPLPTELQTLLNQPGTVEVESVATISSESREELIEPRRAVGVGDSRDSSSDASRSHADESSKNHVRRGVLRSQAENHTLESIRCALCSSDSCFCH